MNAELIQPICFFIAMVAWMINVIRAVHWKTDAIKWKVASAQWRASACKHRDLWREEQDKHAVTNPIHPGLHSDLEADKADRPLRPSVQPSQP